MSYMHKRPVSSWHGQTAQARILRKSKLVPISLLHRRSRVIKVFPTTVQLKNGEVWKVTKQTNAEGHPLMKKVTK